MKSSRLGLFIVMCLCLCSAAVLAAKLLSVQVRDGQLRDAPSFLGKIVAKAEYGQSVDVLEEKGDWSRVSLAGVSGWIHSSALTSQKLSLSSGSGQAGANVSGKEMALAGKGFSAQVEADYRKGHSADYASVDRMEQYSYAPERLISFLKAGGITPQGGAK